MSLDKKEINEQSVETFSQGPWYLMETGFSSKEQVPTIYTTSNDDLEYICKVYRDPYLTNKKQNNLANARLISGAPEMYDLLQEIKNYIKSDLDHPDEIQRTESEKYYNSILKVLDNVEGKSL